MNVQTKSLAAAALLLASGLGAGTASATSDGFAAPAFSNPQATTATYGDWVLGCGLSQDGSGKKTCQVSQTLRAEGKGPIAMIMFAKPNVKAAMSGVVVLPVNATFTSPARLSIDNNDPQPADFFWLRCVGARCLAAAQVKDEILQHWRAQVKGGRMQYKDGDGRDLALPFSFRGLAEALDALTKEQ